MENWDELRTALAVARAGTVSGAAERLGVHHATVIRQIESLESRLGTRLFQRHPRGYALTEAGQILFQEITTVEERIAHLSARIGGAGDRIEGRVILTALPDLGPRIRPVLARILQDYPALQIHYTTAARLLRLETGEAHIAIRAGARPQSGDYIVQSFGRLQLGLYGAAPYLQQHQGQPVENLRFITPAEEGAGAPTMRWLRDQGITPALSTNDPEIRHALILAGQGVGFMADDLAQGLERIDQRPEWDIPLWLVTHRDLHRSARVQAVLTALKSGD